MEEDLFWMMEQYQEKRRLLDECGFALNGPMEPYEAAQAAIFRESLQTEADILACAIADAVCDSPSGDALPFGFLKSGYKEARRRLGKLYYLLDDVDHSLRDYNISSQCTKLLWDSVSSYARLIADFSCNPDGFQTTRPASDTPAAAFKAQEPMRGNSPKPASEKPFLGSKRFQGHQI